MPPVQDFLVLLVVVLQLMILYFLIEINRAVRHRVIWRDYEEGTTKTIAFRITGIVPQKMMNARGGTSSKTRNCSWSMHLLSVSRMKRIVLYFLAVYLIA